MWSVKQSRAGKAVLIGGTLAWMFVVSRVLDTPGASPFDYTWFIAFFEDLLLCSRLHFTFAHGT